MPKHRGKHNHIVITIDTQRKVHIAKLFKPGTKKEAAKESGVFCIRGYGTLNQYYKVSNQFLKFVREKFPGCTSWAESARYIPDFLVEKYRQNVSMQTYKTYRSVLCNTFGESYADVQKEADFINGREIDTVFRKMDITKNRSEYDEKTRLKNDFDRQCAEVLRDTGLRKNELQTLRAGSIEEDKNGNITLYLNNNSDSLHRQNSYCETKGGRPRTVETFICPGRKSYEILKEWVRNSEPNRPILEGKKVSDHINAHHFRSEFANRKYREYAKEFGPVASYRETRIECLRPRSADGLISNRVRINDFHDYKQVCYERRILYKVSQDLGHNREHVVSTNYLSPEEIGFSLVSI